MAALVNSRTASGISTLLSRPKNASQIGYVARGNTAGIPSLALDFTNGNSLDSRITFTRASSATRINSAGLIETVSTDQPRFDYDPVTLQPKGLLIEEQRTNLLTYSERFDNAAWTKGNSSITANAVVSPDGTTTAYKLVEDTTASTTHYAGHASVVATVGQVQTYYVYAKAGERTQLSLAGAGFAAQGFYAIFDLLTGEMVVNTGNAGSIRPAGNGWYRCSITFTPSVASAYQMQIAVSGNNSYTGDGTSGLYIRGAQLEAGSFPTSYIPTTSAQATRAADVATMTGTNFSSWYRQDEGTLFAEFGPYADAGSGKNPGIFQIDDSTTSNVNRMFAGASVSPVYSVVSGGVVQAYLSSGALSPSSISKMAGSYKANDFARSYNGSAAITDTAGSIPTVTRMLLGTGTGGVVDGNIYIRRIAYYPKRLANTELQGITA